MINQDHPLRAARISRNLSIQDLADATGLGRNTILRAEQGSEIRLSSRRYLCDFFEMTAAELGLFPFSGQSEPEQSTQRLVLFLPNGSGEQRQHMDLFMRPGLLREVERFMANNPSRRELLQQFLGLISLSLPLLSAGAPEAGERLARAAQEPAVLDETTIDHYEQITSLCWRLSDEDGLGLIEQLLPEYLPQLATLATQKGKYQMRIASLAAQSCLLGYVIALHREDFQQALSYCQQARVYGQLAHDPNLEAVSLLRQGNVYLYLRSPWRSLEAYQDALPLAGSISPLVRARLHAVMAEVQGKLGTEADVRASMGNAYNAFPTSTKNDPATRYIHFSESGLYLHEGLAFLSLHQGKQAAVALEHVNGLSPKLPISERSRIDILVQQSWAASQIGDLEMFITHMDAAIGSARRLGSDLFLSEAWECYSRQGQWSRETQFKSLGEQFKKGA
jgi:transcriptional regulator with XRE-family HTH domain